jgi:hypothetical protein
MVLVMVVMKQILVVMASFVHLWKEAPRQAQYEPLPLVSAQQQWAQ